MKSDEKDSRDQPVSLGSSHRPPGLLNANAALAEPQPSLNPFSLVLALRPISGKWKIQILCHLISGTKRFSELRRSIPGIGRAMLSFELKALGKDGLIDRTQYETIPPTVEYKLTTKGRKLKAVLLALQRWQEWSDK